MRISHIHAIYRLTDREQNVFNNIENLRSQIAKLTASFALTKNQVKINEIPLISIDVGQLKMM